MDPRVSEGFPDARGIGTSRAAFLAEISRRLPDVNPEQAAIAVFGALAARISGGLGWEILRELAPDTRELFQHYVRPVDAHAGAFDRDEFYLRVAEALNMQADDVRRVISAVFGGLHTQITDATARGIASQLPKELQGTFAAARRRADKPRLE